MVGPETGPVQNHWFKGAAVDLTSAVWGSYSDEPQTVKPLILYRLASIGFKFTAAEAEYKQWATETQLGSNQQWQKMACLQNAQMQVAENNSAINHSK